MAAAARIGRRRTRGLKGTRITLVYLIVALAVLSAGIAFSNALFAAYRAQKELLVASTLESNLAYAEKLAEVVDLYMESIERQLTVSARRIPAIMDSPAALQDEAARVAQQSDGLAGVLIVDRDNKVLAQAAADPSLPQERWDLSGADLRAREERGNVTAPYLCAGRLTVAVTEPVRDAQGNYLGLVAGAIFLQRDTEVDKLLSQHFHRDGSYSYVIDASGQVLYRQESERGELRARNHAVVRALKEGGGAEGRVVRADGEDMLAAYAPMRHGGWGIVVQRPLSVTLRPLRGLMWTIFLYSIPAALVCIVLIALMGYGIAKPLSTLARAVRELDCGRGEPILRSVRAWYFEADQLRQAVRAPLEQHQRRIGELNAETLTDPMTGLLNRRGLAHALERASGRAFAVLALDLDHFKRVNDTYGHAAGDRVLVELATIMRAQVRREDAPCRIGGEEFLVVMPGATAKAALAVAERIRAATAKREMPGGVGRITISIGVARCPDDAPDAEKALERADQALYRAKRGGRNRVVAWSVSDTDAKLGAAPARHTPPDSAP